MLEADVKLIAFVAVLCAALLFLFYKELKVFVCSISRTIIQIFS